MAYLVGMLFVWFTEGIGGISLVSAQILPADSAVAAGQDVSLLVFSPVKTILLISWVYLCIYCVLYVQKSHLVPQQHKPLVSVFSLLVGPLIFIVLIIADMAVRLEEGHISSDEIFKYLFSASFKKSRGLFARSKTKPVDFIELMDTSGKGLSEVQGLQGGSEKLDGRILELTKSIILESIRKGASDILIDPKSDGVYSVRYRVDGFLRDADRIEESKSKAIVNSIKALSAMDIAERRRPQDGSFLAKIPDGNVYFRVASAGVLGGEKLSIRVLNQTAGLLKLADIGMSENNHRKIIDIVAQPAGMAIVCGPTGSGKTTTLYAMLGEIDVYTRNIVTVEDPIEYAIANASQIEVNVKANITFANALRSIVRQDPDVICVGEIRDGETANMALQASQTGHLVLATLHSSSNLSAIVRLMELGAKPLLVASALSVIISQRLVRKLCENCKTSAKLTPEQHENMLKAGLNPDSVMIPVGCPQCGHTGYKGRTAIVDMLFLDDRIKSMLVDNKLSPGEIKKAGDQRCRSTLRAEGLKKVQDGMTTLDEIKRVTSTLG